MEKNNLPESITSLSGNYHDYHDYFRQAEADGLSPDGMPAIAVPVSVVEQSKEENFLLYNYWSRYMIIMNQYVTTSSAAYILFDPNGIVLSAYGNSQILSDLMEKDFLSNRQWTMDSTGPNAVTIGFVEQKRLHSTGSENFHRLLLPYSLYFHPMIMKDQITMSEPSIVGGIALISRQTTVPNDYPVLLAGIAHDLLMNMQFYQISAMAYERTARGVFLIAKHTSPTPLITHISKRMCTLFEIDRDGLCFKPADAVLDPLPLNPEMWDLIENPRIVSDMEIEISVRGRKNLYLISTDVHEQPALSTKGINFYITTQKSISDSVAEQIGNNAVKSFDTIIGRSPSFLSAVKKGRMLTRTDSNIMLLGESGVGKDVFAQAIHNGSARKNKPFIALNCGALPRDLIASELFGYDSGAFTGAKRQGNIGKFELANGGTLFLDELGELPLDLQATLLRAVEQKQIMRLGSNRLIDVDVKIISATNADIPTMIEQKRFRADLYYRLSTMQLTIPPLRDRGDDIILLAEYFIDRVSHRIGRTDRMILSPEAKKCILALPWSGNIRELQNLMERIVQLYPDPVIEIEHILENSSYSNQIPTAVSSYKSLSCTAPAQKRELLTREQIQNALMQCNGNRSEAARYLGIARKTLYRNMERLNMEI